ncbi:MAG TPA: helix-turn-helix domain-containing protein [Luteibaculaceae bacterium]|nr:helix-turn-helix domain-containing protein [Luteibaculaceae bacterium]
MKEILEFAKFAGVPKEVVDEYLSVRPVKIGRMEYDKEVRDIVLKHCSEVFGSTIKATLSNTRIKPSVEARRVAMYIFRNHCLLSLVQIGKITKRHHATVINMIGHVDSFLENERAYRLKMHQIVNLIQKDYEQLLDERKQGVTREGLSDQMPAQILGTEAIGKDSINCLP